MKIRIFVVIVDDAQPRCILFATEWAARNWVLRNIILPALPVRERQSVERAFTVDSREIIREFLPSLPFHDIIRWEGDLPLLSMTADAARASALHMRGRVVGALSHLRLSNLSRKGNRS